MHCGHCVIPKKWACAIFKKQTRTLIGLFLCFVWCFGSFFILFQFSYIFLYSWNDDKLEKKKHLVSLRSVEKSRKTNRAQSLTSVAPWESCWLTSSPCLSSSWMSPSIRLSVDARVSLIISWVMPVNQMHKQNHSVHSWRPLHATAACWQSQFFTEQQLRYNETATQRNDRT